MQSEIVQRPTQRVIENLTTFLGEIPRGKTLNIHEMLIMFAQKIYMAKIAEHLKIFNLAYVILLNSCDLNSYKI